ncbi:coadhesin-like isoform X2 [Ruditapes philippinarum]|uniref:coadhesin-like isoform X2 n=1 Tax=Ruditapes philippinarum TaxID=129788 RepID=UPI00295C0D41|nr:coadhesin-like isoform X2 [Ruditapes philippinarum]
MELDDIEMITTRSNDEIAYENLKITTEKSATESQSKKIEEEPYETLKYGESDKRNIETGNVITVKRLKYVIYVLIVLISVVYITLVTLVIVLFVPKTPANGRWAQWSSWTSCDVTCGNGTHLRTRMCTNPVPAKKGSDCIGENLQSSECSKDNCPVNGQWTPWSTWTSCDVTCGQGTHLRSRTCTNPVPAYNGLDCTGDNLQSAECSKESCQVNGHWAQWSSWTSCDVTCGNGKYLRLRTCTNPVPMNKGSDCIGETLQSSECSKDNCPVNGQWAHWSSWTSCDVTCGKGTRQRSRTCTNPVPANGGPDCTGAIRETDECSKDACPVDGQWTNWSSWTSCDVAYGIGRQLRTRRCTNPMPEHKGKDCLGESIQSRQCSNENFPIDTPIEESKEPPQN